MKIPGLPPAPRKLAGVTAFLLGSVVFTAIATVNLDSGWSVSIFEAAVLAIGFVWSIFVFVRPFRVRLHPVLLPFAGVVALGALQLLTGRTLAHWDTATGVLRWVTYFAAFGIALQLGGSPEIRGRFLRALLYFGVAFAALAAIQHFADPGKIFGIVKPELEYDDYYGPFSNRDHFAAFMELLLPIALYEAFADKRRLVRGSLMAAVVFASVIECASRAGSALVIVETFLVLFIAYRRKLPSAQNGIRTLAVAVAAIAILTVAVGWTHLWERVHEANPYRFRQLVVMSSVEMIRAKPLTGFGIGNFENAYPAFAQYDDGTLLGHAHNDWLEWAVEGGLPLAILVLAIVVLSAPSLWRSLWGLGVLSVFTHCAIDFPMQRPAIALWVFVLMGLACGARRFEW